MTKLTIQLCVEKPWFSARLKILLNKKQRLYRTAKLSQSVDAWERYNQCQQTSKFEIKNAKKKFYNEDLSKLMRTNPKKFWTAVNPKQGKECFPFTDASGNEMSTAETCEQFSRYFKDVFSEDQFPLPDFDSDHNSYEEMAPLTIYASGVMKLIDELPSNSAPGPDKITSKLLKLCKYECSSLLSLIFQQSLDSGEIPDDWKHAQVIPIYKSGSKNEFSNYRPISLTSVPSKLMEHIVFSNIMNHLRSHNYFFVNQHGFRRSHSCETQLFQFTNDIHENLHCRTETHAIFIDFQKAFDKVPHLRLMLKIRSLKIDPFVIEWISTFIYNRAQSVHYNDKHSSKQNVKSGVPQGTVLGPLLFLIYVNDLPTCIRSTIRLYADDCVIYRKIERLDDCALFQGDLTCLEAWCEKWNTQHSF